MSLQSNDTEQITSSLSLSYSLHILNFFIPDYLRLPSKDFSSIQTLKDICILYNKINSNLTTAFSSETIIEEDIPLPQAIEFISDLLREERHVILNVLSPIINENNNSIDINNDIDDEASMAYLVLLLCFYFSFKDNNTLFRGLTAMNQHDQFEYLILLNRYINLEMSTSGIVISLLLSLHNKISSLEERLKTNRGNSNNDSQSSFSHTAYESMGKSTVTILTTTVNTMSQFNSPISNKQLKDDCKVLIDSPIKLDFSTLTEQDYLNIIVKKDYDLNQLQLKLDAYMREVNENKRLILKKTNKIESLKRDIEANKAQYEIEFELMASAMYNIGSVLMQNKERNNMLISNDCGLSSNWLKRKQNLYSQGGEY